METEDNIGNQAKAYQYEAENQNKRSTNNIGLLDTISKPLQWFKMLSEELHWSFVLSVVIVYGISIGLYVGLGAVSIMYYMKDEQKLQPPEAQVYIAMTYIPWALKPFWGIVTDAVPILGFRRKPYFVIGGCVSVIPLLVLWLSDELPLAAAVLCLIMATAGKAIGNVTIDACVTQNSVSHPALAADMQSLCGLSTSTAAVVGFTLSGFILRFIGPKGVFGILCLASALVMLAGITLKESPIRSFAHRQTISEKCVETGKSIWKTMKSREVGHPCLFMYFSTVLALAVRDGMFFWYTEAEEGPRFSKEVVGTIYSFSAGGSLVAVLMYQNYLKSYRFYDIVFWALLLHGASGLLDVIWVLRINLRLGLPDYLLSISDEIVSTSVGRIKAMPFLVLCSKLAPSGAEATFFALLTSIDYIGLLSSSWAAGLLLHLLNVTRTRFDNLWLAILIRSICRVAPIALLFLIPQNDPNPSTLAAADASKTKKGDDMIESQNLEMASLINTT